ARAAFVAHGDDHGAARRLGDVDRHRLGTKRVREQDRDDERRARPEHRAEPELHRYPFLLRHAQSRLFSTATRSIRSSWRRTRSPDAAVTTITTSPAYPYVDGEMTNGSRKRSELIACASDQARPVPRAAPSGSASSVRNAISPSRMYDTSPREKPST